MAVYAPEKLIEETRRLAAEFRRSTGTLLPVSGEIARFDVSRHLGLVLAAERDRGYDAIGTDTREGMRIQIKSRVVGDAVKPGHRIGQLNPDGEWDLVILSLMDDDYEPQEMYEASREIIMEEMSGHGSKRRKRGAISVAKFKIIGELVWTRELGPEY